MTRKEYRRLKKARVRVIERYVTIFRMTVKTEEDAIAYILDLYHQGDGFRCTCGNVLSQEINTRMTKCGVCNRDCWLTADTMFDHAQRLVPYLTAVYLRTNGVEVQKGELADVTGVSSSTADLIFKKISMVLTNEMTGDFQEFSSSTFLEVFKRRSRATPRFAHPRAEEDEFESQRVESATEITEVTPIEVAPMEVVTPDLEPRQRITFDAISSGESFTFDRLLDITQLSISDLSYSVVTLQAEFNLIRRDDIGQYARTEVDSDGGTNATPKNDPPKQDDSKLKVNQSAISYIKRLHGGTARKYIQFHVADHWSLEEPKRWNNNALFQACLRSKPITREDISEYVSPANIKVSQLILQAVA
ncbi:MAG: hypothetical protein K2X93_17665 [Candidatus Obscuribacterales bacterium]|nr:hypothetical protein [Candidatus Obscuribacterales bacterium]